MKKKFLKGVTATVVVALVGYGVSRSVNNSSTELSDLTLANIEALADGESFYFNGQYWTTEEQWYNNRSGDWKPVLRDCPTNSVSSGYTISMPLPPPFPSGSTAQYQYQEDTQTSKGKEVICVHGSGNCWNGTDCKKA